MIESSILSSEIGLEIPYLISPSWQNQIKKNQKQDNLNGEISYENDLLNTPEQLEMEKRTLKTEINKLRKEIQPLQDDYNRLKKSQESQQNSCIALNINSLLETSFSLMQWNP